jgi:succinate dehydrogenase / fumarate reductase membrane anchor subunit
MGGGTKLGQVRGLGSAGHGAHHWLHQRLTAIANFALLIWLIASLLRLDLGDHGAVTAWMARPLVAVPLILLIASIFYHLRLGLQVLIEDYVHSEAVKLLALVLLNFYAVGGAAFGIFAIAKIAFTAGGAA